MVTLKDKFAETALPYIKDVKGLIKTNADTVVDNVTLGQLYGGMRDVISLVTETSLLDPVSGIAFRDMSIEDVQSKMPASKIGSKEPYAETIFTLLLLGRLPTQKEVEELTADWQKRAKLPTYVYNTLDSLPKGTHPMVKLTTAISAMNHESLFNKAYHDGSAKKDNLWEYAYEDSMNIIANIPHLVAYIYHDGKKAEADTSLDWSGNLAHMLSDKDKSKTSLLKEFMRLYIFLHADHEGGNASAYTCHVVGSTLASPYGAYASAMHSLAGPLHGLASQTALEWIEAMVKKYKGVPTKEQIELYIQELLTKGSVVPGYGHAVLRKPDPRFIAQMLFAKKHNLESDLLKTVWNVYEVAPKVLGQVAKIKNPYPNVDAHSGAILNYFGFKEPEFYTVLFGASRAIGVLAQQIWDRAFGYPITRPKSVTSEWIKNNTLKK